MRPNLSFFLYAKVIDINEYYFQKKNNLVCLSLITMFDFVAVIE